MGEAARGYSWPPFQPANTVGLRHGIWWERSVGPLAEKFTIGLLADRPALAGFPEAVMAWARAEARCVLLAEWFEKRGLFDSDGKERPGLRYIGQFERLAAELRGRLGLDPKAELELMTAQAGAVHAAADLEGLVEKGRQALAQSEAENGQ